MKASLLRHLDGVGAHVSGCPYREASRRLHIAQPAISQTVADLEQELGLKLFSRAKRVAQLTPVFAWSDELAVSRLYSMAASTTARIACPKVSSHGEASSPVRLCGGLIREIDGDAKASQLRWRDLCDSRRRVFSTSLLALCEVPHLS
jgi:hypothetical protein